MTTAQRPVSLDARLVFDPRRPVEYRRLHLCNGLDPRRDGGMVPSILGMTGALAERHGPVTIATPTASLRETFRVPPGVSLVGPVDDLERYVRRAEVVQMHGLWQGHTRRGSAEARRHGIPYIIAAHGMADPWALAHKAFKKKVYTALVEGKNLRRAAALHALSKPEIGHLRALAPKTPIAWIPNGVDLRPFEDLPGRHVLESEYPELAGKFLLLFYGRLHVKKGLDLLARAFAAVSGDYPDLHLLIAGNDDGARADFEQRLSGSNLSDRTTFLGHVAGERARTVWGAADAFTLPSYSEGFSMAILEALAARKPVVVSTACHFPELATLDAGIVVEPNAESLEIGLRQLLERSPLEREALAFNGRSLVEREYTWGRQADRLAELYRWVVQGGNEPDSLAH